MPPIQPTLNALGSDAAVYTREQDEFQRYPFAKRIAETIRGRQDSSSLVLALYGKWGAGKTSVLHFIEEELRDSEVIAMSFNPWMFSGEEQLLLGFFGQLSEVIGQLETGADAVKILAEYSKKVIAQLAFFRPEATEAQIQAIKSAASLESFKIQLSELLQRTGKRILILIDDLDRLDKQEIQAMLRLVKLTGDFQYTTYLLAFDEVMVARAVGERYPGGGKTAGRRFLEKIIQVPLQLPVIQKEAMLTYFEKRLLRCLELTGIQLPVSEQERLTSSLSESALRLSFTPRDVSRYTNTLLVVMPLLQGEVNMVDLMLLEALKVFFPPLYKVAATNQHLLTGAPDRQQLDELHKRSDHIFGEKAEKLGNARSIFFSLFPVLKNLYAGRTYFLFGDRRVTEDDLYRTKSVASTYYFKRYFSYAVQEGEIPDGEYQLLLTYVREQQIEPAYTLAAAMIARSSDNEFLRLLEVDHTEVAANNAESYCHLLVRVSNNFSTDNLNGRFFRMVARAPGLFLSYLLRIPSEQERLGASTYALMQASFPFSYNLLFDIYRITHLTERGEFAEVRAFFTAERYREIATVLIERAIQESEGQVFFEYYGGYSLFLLMAWHIAYGSEPINTYLESVFNQNTSEIMPFIRYMSPQGLLNGQPKFGHLERRDYNLIASLCDVELLHRVALEVIGDTPLLPYAPDVFTPPTDVERLHEFVHLHNNPAEEESTGAEEVIEG